MLMNTRKAAINQYPSLKQKKYPNQKLNLAIQRKDKKLQWLTDTMPNKKITQQISEQIEKEFSQIEELKERLNEIEAKMNESDFENVNAEIIADFLKNFSEMFDKLENGQRKLLIQSVVKRVTVYNNLKIHVKFALPVAPGDAVASLCQKGWLTGFEPATSRATV